MKHSRVPVLAIGILLTAAGGAAAQERAITPDLSAVPEGKGWKLSAGRKAVAFTEDGKKGVRFDKQPGYSVAWLEAVEFGNGTIEVDIRGEDKPQQSFLGVAFRVVDGQTHDAVYFRPFNFRSTDPVRTIHAVQYVSHPGFPWMKLREEKNGIYEKAVNPVPDPNGWFHARIVVGGRKVSVFVDGATEPSLVVGELSERTGGKVGLWVGEGSAADFANLKITPAK
jgi:hypothetical protein